jgi:hypothetical protein
MPITESSEHLAALHELGIAMSFNTFVDFCNNIDTITCKPFDTVPWILKETLNWFTQRKFLTEYELRFNHATDNGQLTLRFSDTGNQILDVLYGADKLPPLDVNDGVNRQLFWHGFQYNITQA